MTRMDSLLSHGMGILHAARARLSGLVGVFQALAEQHAAVSTLLERARASDAKFTHLWPALRRELLSHERAELRELYPVLRANPATAALADQHDSQSRELEHLIAQIDRSRIGTPDRRALYDRLIEAVTHHAHEEETTIFPRAQDALGKELAVELEAAVLATKRAIAAPM